MTTAFVNERNLIIAKEVQRIAKETNKTTIASSFKLDKASKRGRGVIGTYCWGFSFLLYAQDFDLRRCIFTR